MKKITSLYLILLSATFSLLSLHGSAATLYWVGGSGDWHNANHWSFSSDGNGGAKVPESTDDVIFDQYSFSSFNENVSFSGVMECHNITFSDNVSVPTISGVSSSSFEIYGSFILSPQLTWNYTGVLEFKSSSTGNIINACGKLLNENISFEGSGSWQLGGAMLLSEVSTLTLNSGTLTAQGHPIECGTLKITGASQKLLNINHSLLVIKQDFDETGAVNFQSSSTGSKIYYQHLLPLNSLENLQSHFSSHRLNPNFIPGVISVDSVIINPTCNAADTGNSCDGAIIIRHINATNGGPFSISWAGPNDIDTVTTDSAFNLCPNTYSYTIFDSADNSVYGPIFVNIIAPPPLTTNYVKRNERCNGNCDAWIITRISGETPNYTYRWSNGTSGTAIGNPSNSFYDSALCAGSYAIRIIDSRGCVNTFKTNVTQPQPITITFSAFNLTCNGNCNALASTTVTGGHGGYTYSWAPGGQTTSSINGLCAGTYSLTVKDDSGCVGMGTVTITQPNPIVITTSQTNVSCNGDCNGIATATVSGGTPSYVYQWSPSGGSGSSATALCAGTYKVIVTDAHGCKDSASVTITQPPSLSLSVTQTNVTCNGNCNGKATVTASGGTSPYTYAWTPSGGSGSTATALCPGTYTITVTDNNSCSATQTVTITQPSALTASITSSTNLKCNGNCNGKATVTASGGTSPYTYAWTPSGGSGATASNLCAGTYTITVTDNNGCTTSASVTITQPPPFTASISSTTNVTCNGDCNGKATVSTSGGTSPFTYAWSPSGGSGATASSLCPGIYTVTVTDNNGCSATASVTITQPAPLTATIPPGFNLSCNGNCNGTASVSVTGGTTPYTYAWTPSGGSGSTASNLCAGSYTVTVTDNNGCTATSTITITQPPPIIATITSSTNITCNGNCNGSATLSVSGGTSPYNYSWMPGGNTNQNVTGLCAGSYTVTVTDSHFCTVTASVTITQPPLLTASISSTTNVTCNGDCNGKATASASGGTLPYTYAWSPSGGSAATASSLCPGIYTITVTDYHGCTATATVTITQPLPLTVTIPPGFNLSCNGNCNGTASVIVTGGTTPYTYAWTPSGGSGSTASNLCAGSYTVTVTDNNGCTATSSITITQPPPIIATITSSTNLTCNGNCNGAATVSASGGTSPYNYSWMPGGSTNLTVTGLCAGTYTVTVTDSHFCMVTVSVTITQPPVLTASISTVMNVTCNGNCNGLATVTAGGGTAPYTYSWNPVGGSGATASALCAGGYTVTVTDNNGCTATVSVTITQASTLTASITSSTNVTCNGNCNGTATVSANGGATPYTYAWSPSGGNGATASSLCPGIYFVTVTDNNGCSATATVTITQPQPLTVTIPPGFNLSCNGNCNGTASASVSGGTSPYTYAWSPSGGNGQNAGGLCAGTYTVTVTDNNGCIATATTTITQPTAITTSITSTINESCNGNCNGSATISASGGSPPYNYTWSPSGGTNPTATGLCAGTYTLTITDSHFCTDTVSVTITQPALLVATITTVANVTCNGSCNGMAMVSASGGTAPYTYSWNPVGGSNQMASGLCPGTYTVTVTDNNNCSATASVTITEPTLLTASISSSANILCNGSCNGTATVTANGGTAPYTYSWNPVGGTNQTASSLCAGSFTVTVTDNNGCTATASVTLTQPATAVSATITSSTNISCNGNCNGSATVSASGGISPYTYTWSPSGGSDSIASGLCSGNYSVTVTDSNGCSAIATVTITQPNPINIATAQSNTLCYGSCNGTATAMASGGSSPYTYSWSNGQTSQTATGLCAGSYTVTITDSSGCSFSTTVSISSPAQLTDSVTTNTIFCHNSCDGIAVVSVSGGVSPYTYAFSNGFSNAIYYNDTITNLCPGITYTITIRDSNGCSIIDSVFFNNPAGMAVTNSITGSSCNNINNGAVSVTVSGGTAPYTFLWSNGNTTQNLSNILSGTYILTIKDSNGCITTDTAIVPSNNTIIANAGRDTSVCANTPVLLTGINSFNAASYIWFQMPGFNTISDTVSVSVSPSVTTIFTLVVSNGGCTDTSAVTVTINPALSVNAGPTQSITPNESVTIGGNPTAPGGSTYLWVPGSGLNDSTVANPVATPTITTTYTVYCDNPSGCPGSDTVTVFVIPQITVPGGFTPNGDGVNDFWNIGYVDNFPGVVVEVYNRWGELLFRSVGYKTPWDGTYNGKPVPVGTYYYIINLHDPRFTQTETGPVTILR
jgi:large repetitive protein